MATSDWRGLYTVPELRYGEIYTNQDDWVLPENKQLNKYYRHRAYRGGDLPKPRPGLTADYGVQHSTLEVVDALAGQPVAPEARMPKTQSKVDRDMRFAQSTFDKEMRFAGDNFMEMKSIAENIPARKWQ